MKKPVRRRLPPLLQVMLPPVLAGLGLLTLLVGVSAAAPVDLTGATAYDQTVAEIIAQVTTPTLAYELAGLTGERPVTVAGISYTIATRNSYQAEAISMATAYAYEQFAGAGLVVTYHNYTWNGYHWRNVVAEKPGVVDAGEVYLLVAHVDDMPEESPAPGADDNGSGSAAVLRAARLLAPYHFAYTIRFVLFTGEEQGLRGSDAYAAGCVARAENIRGVINLDMIGYNTGTPVYDAYARSGTYLGAAESRQLADFHAGMAATYGLDLVPLRVNSNGYPLVGGSDQWSFLKWGYPAIMVIEDYVGNDFTPYYHQVGDTLDTLDLDYYADLTRASIAAIAHLAEPLSVGYLSGTATDLETSLPLSGATVLAWSPAYASYTLTAVAGAGGVYTRYLPVGSYTLTARMDIPPYYAVTVAGVSVVTDTVTVRDFVLGPWPRWYIPMVVYAQ